MRQILYRSNSFRVIKAIICMSIIIQLSATIYVAIDFTKLFNLIDFKASNIKVHDIRLGTIISIVVFNILQLLGLYGTFKELLCLSLIYAFLSALQTILWFVLVFYSTIFLASFIFTIVLTTLSLIYCYKIPRDGIGSSGQTRALVMRHSPSVIVTQMFGGQHQLQELYVSDSYIDKNNIQYKNTNKAVYSDPNTTPNPYKKPIEEESTYVKF